MKKLILPGIFIFVTILLFNFLTLSPIFGFFGDEPQSDGEFDCSSTLSEAVNPASAWKSIGATAEKRTLKREDNDYCLLKHQSHVSDYGYSIGGVEDPVITWTVRITYLKDKASSDRAFKYLNTLKKSEKASFKIGTDSIFEYSGQTSDLSGPNYFKDNSFQGRCLIQHTVESNLAPVINSIYKWSLSDVEGLMSMMGEWAKGLTYDLSSNQNLTNFCNGEDFIPANLIPSDGSESSSRDNEPAGLSIDPVQAINDWIMENDLISDPARLERMEREKRDLELYGRTPEMTAAIIKKAQEEWESSFSKPVSENIVVVGGGGQLETPEEKTVEEGDFLPNGSTVSGDWLWGRLDIDQSEKISVLLSLDDFHAKINSDSIDLQRGEVEFKSLGDIKTHPVFTVKTDNAEITTRDTHFWVSFDKNKQSTTVGVYEGQVDVITKDGKTTTVNPNGDKPGVVVVSQKLSIVKLAIAVLVLITLIGGAIFILRKRFSLKSFKKRK